MRLSMKKNSDKRKVVGDVNYGGGPHVELDVIVADKWRKNRQTPPQWQTVFCARVSDFA